jgi:hypothetical protein
MNEHPSPEFEKEIRGALEAPDAAPSFVRDLRVTLIQRSTMKRKTRSLSRLAWSIAVTILLIGLLIASPQVVQALKRILGYIPGIGYVEPGDSLRMLVEPVALERDGVKITIEKAVSDSTGTILLEHIEGYTPDRSGMPACDDPAQLLLPDGTALAEKRFETTMETPTGSPQGRFYGRYLFGALPTGQMDATLEIPCVMYDARLRDFKLSLHFQLAGKTAVMPVIELPTQAGGVLSPAQGTPQIANPPGAATASDGTVQGFDIVLESETPLDDGYILAGSYRWTDTRFDWTSLQPNDPKLQDANGREVAFEPVEPAAPTEPTGRKLPFAYKITGKDHAWPLTIRVESVVANLPDQALFQFDAGPNPQVGQSWDVSIDVPVAGHVVHVQQIRLSAGRTPTELGYDFMMTSDSGVLGASINDANPIINNHQGGGGGGGGGGANGSSIGPFTYGWALEGYSPSGIKTFFVSNLAIRLSGGWTALWSPTSR